MKLFRWKKDGKTLPGIIMNEPYYDVSVLEEDYNEEFFETDGLSRLKAFIGKNRQDLKKLE